MRILLIIKIIGFTIITHNKPQMPIEAICILSLSSLSNRRRKKIKICQIVIPKNIIKIFSMKIPHFCVLYEFNTSLNLYILYHTLLNSSISFWNVYKLFIIKLYGPIIGPQVKNSDGYYKLHKDLLSAAKKFVHYVNWRGGDSVL